MAYGGKGFTIDACREKAMDITQGRYNGDGIDERGIRMIRG
jgi:hypothetical protein